MKKIEYYNRLIINDDSVALAHDKDIQDVLTLDDGSDVYHLENGSLSIAYGDFTEAEFTDMYAEDENGEYELEDDYGNVKKYNKVDFAECEQHYIRLSSQHGINTSEYDITDAEIIEVEVFKAEHSIAQDYPRQPHTNFYKTVAQDGTAYYIVEKIPFFADEQDNSQTLISEEEFDKYED